MDRSVSTQIHNKRNCISHFHMALSVFALCTCVIHHHKFSLSLGGRGQSDGITKGSMTSSGGAVFCARSYCNWLLLKVLNLDLDSQHDILNNC